MRALIQNAGFRRLWFAQIVLALGDSCMRMGLLEFFRVHGLNVKVETAKILFAVALPGALLGPVAMAYLDRWQRRSVLMVSDALRMVLVLIIAAWLLPLLTGRVQERGLTVVYGMVFLIGAITTFSYPARYAWMPNLVEAEKLVQANTLFTTSLAVANIVGLSVGGVVAEAMGAGWALTANALAYVGSIALVWNIRTKPHETTGGKGVDPAGSWAELTAGLSYLWRHPTAMPLVVLSAVFAFLLAVLMVAIVGYAVETLSLGTAGFAYLVSAAGVGAGLGVVAMGRGRPWTRSNWLPFLQLIVVGALLWLLGSTTRVWVAVPLLAVLGAVGATVLIPIDAKLQEQVDDQRRGAVFAARGVLTSVTMVLAFWLQFGTTTFRRTPPPTILLWLGLGSIAAALLTLLVARARRMRAAAA